MNKNALACLLAFSIAAPSLAFADAPFGLTWGMSKAELEGQGVALSPEASGEGLESYSTDLLPIDLSNADFYLLYFGKDRGLQKVSMASDNISNDIYGTKGKEAYDRLKTALTEKYGDPIESFSTIGGKLWKDADEFYQCLAYDGCGIWASFFENKESNEFIGLELKGLNRGEGYLTLAYDGPEWGTVLSERDAETASQDSSAL
jgi:hypothetical protein|tara:strand:- start:2093 stop:2704 length:612 start_codon:yes stop_codon:yes gene_type:complete